MTVKSTSPDRVSWMAMPSPERPPPTMITRGGVRPSDRAAPTSRSNNLRPMSRAISLLLPGPPSPAPTYGRLTIDDTGGGGSPVGSARRSRVSRIRASWRRHRWRRESPGERKLPSPSVGLPFYCRHDIGGMLRSHQSRGGPRLQFDQQPPYAQSHREDRKEVTSARGN